MNYILNWLLIATVAFSFYVAIMLFLSRTKVRLFRVLLSLIIVKNISIPALIVLYSIYINPIINYEFDFEHFQMFILDSVTLIIPVLIFNSYFGNNFKLFLDINLATNIFLFTLTVVLILIVFNTSVTGYVEVSETDYNNKINVGNYINEVIEFLVAFYSALLLISRSRINIKISFLVMLLYTSMSLYFGSRGVLIYWIFVIMYLFSKAIDSGRLGYILKYALLFPIIFFALTQCYVYIEKSRSNSFFVEQSSFYDYDQIISSVDQKFNRIKPSLDLLENYDRVGFLPYEGLLYVLVPKFLYENKPRLGSTNHEVENTPNRLVVQLMDPNNKTLALDVSPLAASIWSFGYGFGVFFFMLVFLINLWLCCYILRIGAIFLNFWCMYFISFQNLGNIYSPPYILIKNIFLLIIVFILYFSFIRYRRLNTIK